MYLSTQYLNGNFGMKNIFLFVVLLYCFGYKAASQNRFSTNKANIEFICLGSFSDIEGKSLSGKLSIDFSTGYVEGEIPMKSFNFDKGFTQQHFNDWYLETKKYPKGRFYGKIDRIININKDGVYEGNMKGKLILKNIVRDRIVPYKIVVKGGQVTAETRFNATTIEYGIDLPEIFRDKVSESVSVSIKAELRKN